MFSHTTIEDSDLFLTFTSRASQSLHIATGGFMSFYYFIGSLLYSLMKTAGLRVFWRQGPLSEFLIMSSKNSGAFLSSQHCRQRVAFELNLFYIFSRHVCFIVMSVKVSHLANPTCAWDSNKLCMLSAAETLVINSNLKNSHRIPGCLSAPCAHSSKSPSGLHHTAWSMWKNAVGT